MYFPLKLSAKSYNSIACFKRVAEYDESTSLNKIDAAAKVEAVSAATSDPGFSASTLYEG